MIREKDKRKKNEKERKTSWRKGTKMKLLFLVTQMNQFILVSKIPLRPQTLKYNLCVRVCLTT